MPKKPTVFGRIINELGLAKIHPIFDKSATLCNNIFEKYLDSSSRYKIISFVEQLEDSTEDEETKDQFFSQVNLCFEIYHNIDINTLWATHFVTNYCKSDLATILGAFKSFNGINTYHQEWEIANEYDILTEDELKKIFDVYLIVNLAAIFSIIAHCERIVTESGKTEAKKSDFASIDGMITMFKKEMGNFDYSEPRAGFKPYYRKDAALKRAVMLSWKWYRIGLDEFFAMDDTKMKEYLLFNPEFRAIFDFRSGKKSDKTKKVDRKNIIEKLFTEQNFFYVCSFLNKNIATSDDLCVSQTDFTINKLTIEI